MKWKANIDVIYRNNFSQSLKGIEDTLVLMKFIQNGVSLNGFTGVNIQYYSNLKYCTKNALLNVGIQ